MRLVLPVAPETERIEIEARLGQSLAQIQLLHDTVMRADERAARLAPTNLAKAFRSELLPQDPPDDPASVLLDRIRASRAAESAQPRRGGVRGANDREATEATTAPSNGRTINER